MSRFTFVTWDGGGNVPPAVGIAQELIARGNEVRFLGYVPQQAALSARGLAFSALPRSGVFDLYGERAPEQRLSAIIRNVWASPEHLEDIPDALAAHPADVLVVDFSMNGALAQAQRTDIPVAVLAHSCIAGLVPASRGSVTIGKRSPSAGRDDICYILARNALHLSIDLVAKEEPGLGLMDFMAAETDPTVLLGKVTINATAK